MIYDIDFCVPDRHIASTILGIYLQFLTLQKSMTLETGRQVDMHQRKSDTHTHWIGCVVEVLLIDLVLALRIPELLHP